MKDILVISTSRSLQNKVSTIMHDQGLSRITLNYCKDVTSIINFIQHHLPDSTEVIVTTLGPAKLITELLGKKLPVLALEYNNIDIIQYLNKALSFPQNRVALGYNKSSNTRLSDILSIVKQEFEIFAFEDDDEINVETLNTLESKGINTIVGGKYICNLARKMGFAIFSMPLSKLTLKNIIESAMQIADTRSYLKQYQKNLNTILSNQSSAIVAVNKKNEITFFNKPAEFLFGIAPSDALGKKSYNILPDNNFLYALNGNRIENCTYRINGAELIGEYIPLLENDTVVGGTAIFTTMHDIHKKDEYIRKVQTSKAMQTKYQFDNFYTTNSSFKKILKKAKYFAMTDETILITGESGTGKEVMAGSIHNASQRHAKPFTAINCAAIPNSLIESELFGYEPGSFTGGKKGGSPGIFELAHGGTLFLDEIGEISLDMQSKLLRVIQESEVRRIGASESIPINVRIIAATNKQLSEQVLNNKFRLDLYYRLNVLHIEIPPLREYRNDIGKIAEHILARIYPNSSPECFAELHTILAKLDHYAWSGNLRELENIIRRYASLYPYFSKEITFSDIIDDCDLSNTKAKPLKDQDDIILTTYYNMDCNKTLTAEKLGISRSTLWRKLKQLNA